MAKKRSPEDVVIEFFQTAPLERVEVVLAISRGIVKRRTPLTVRQIATRKRKSNVADLQPPPDQAAIV